MGTLQGRLETLEHQRGADAPPAPEPAALRAEIEVLKTGVGVLKGAVAALQKRPKPKGAAAPTKLSAERPKTVKEQPAAAGDALPTGSRALFSGAKKAMSAGAFERARALMERWLATYGRRPSKQKAVDDAYVTIGESYKAQDQPKDAIRAFQKVYKMGVKKADMWTRAVFRMGQCFEALNDKAGARAFHKMAAAKGRGRYAKRAAQRLKRLR
jgi:tetratricopeptide (TPR) repeat protein